MKKLFFITLTAMALMSCGDKRHTVRLTNGALVNARNFTGVDYPEKSKVCLVNVNGHGWTFCNDGDLADTTYSVKRKDPEGNTHYHTVVHRVGTLTGL